MARVRIKCHDRLWAELVDDKGAVIERRILTQGSNVFEMSKSRPLAGWSMGVTVDDVDYVVTEVKFEEPVVYVDTYTVHTNVEHIR